MRSPLTYLENAFLQSNRTGTFIVWLVWRQIPTTYHVGIRANVLLPHGLQWEAGIGN